MKAISARYQSTQMLEMDKTKSHQFVYIPTTGSTIRGRDQAQGKLFLWSVLNAWTVRQALEVT